MTRRAGEELRRGRIAAGLSQRTVAAAVGVSHSTLGRIERGEASNVSVITISSMAAVVGFELTMRLFPSGSPLRDKAHHALLDRAHASLHPSLVWRTEVPFPNPGDLRAWDAAARGPELLIAFEAETGPRDGQELQRRLSLKRRDGGADRVILVLSDTRGNREFLRHYGPSLRVDFPVPQLAALRALRKGRDPGGDALLVL